MKRSINNRGFTLVELIVSVAILGIIALGASAFMAAGSKAYSNLNYTVRLQYESQLAMSQLQEYTVDCATGLAWDDSETTLYIVNDSTVHLFDFDETAGTLSYGTGTAAQTLSVIADAPMAEHIKSMDVTLQDADMQAEITLTLCRENRRYTATQIISLRNQPALAESWAALWNEIK